MTAIIHVPSVSRVAGAPHISDLPFPRANVRSWISGNGYRLAPGTDKIESLIDRNNTDLEYPTLSSIGQLGFVSGDRNGINILRSMSEAYPSEPTGTAYGSAVAEMSGKVSFMFLVKWGGIPEQPPAGVARDELFNIRAAGIQQHMFSISVLSTGEIRLIVRRTQADPASIILMPYTGSLSDYSCIIAEVDYFANTMSLEADGSKYVDMLSTQTGEAPVMPENTFLEIGGMENHIFRGALSDMIWFEGNMDEKAKDKVKSYLTSKQAALNEI